ncbi:MAG: DUF2752 domain-containing protein [Leeuwenhoekiella sp.]
MLPCLIKKYFGFDCLGCGIQRAAAFIIQGRFTDAFHMYPAIYPLLFLFGYTGLSIFVKLKFASFITPALAIISVLTMIVSYCFKMFY